MAATKSARSPINCQRLLKCGITTFTIDDIAEKLDIPRRDAFEAIRLGVTNEVLRPVESASNANGVVSQYENPRWRRYWLTKSWVSFDPRDLEGEL